MRNPRRMIHHGQLRIPNLDSTIFEVQCGGAFKSVCHENRMLDRRSVSFTRSWYGATPSSWMESSKSSFFTSQWIITLVPSGFTSNQLVAFDPRKYDYWIWFPYFLCQCPYNHDESNPIPASVLIPRCHMSPIRGDRFKCAALRNGVCRCKAMIWHINGGIDIRNGTYSPAIFEFCWY